jgi:hypothetical protein
MYNAIDCVCLYFYLYSADDEIFLDNMNVSLQFDNPSQEYETSYEEVGLFGMVGAI